MKPINLINSSLLFIYTLFLLVSCVKDLETIRTDNINSEWGVPLVKSKLTLADFLNDTSGAIHVNPDGLISLIYESDDLVSVEAKERTKIPDQLDTDSVWFDLPEHPAPPLPIVLEDTLYFTITFDLEEEGQRIDRLDLRNGTYHLTLRTNLQEDSATILLIIPNFVNKFNNEPLQRSFNLSNSQGFNEIILEANINLSNYYVQFENDPPNKIDILGYVNLVINDSGIASTNYVTLENRITNIDYTKYIGYIGRHTESYIDTIDLNIYNSSDFGNITFGPDCVDLTIDVQNEVGIPMKIAAEEFTAYHTVGSLHDSIEIDLFGPDSSNVFNILSPFCDDVNHASTEILLNKSNIIDALDISPNKVYIKLNGIFNDGADSLISNCFRDTSDIIIRVKVELDLFGSISAFKVADTLDFSLESIENLNAIEFRIEIINGFPINASTQVVFSDSDFQPLYSLFPAEEDIIVSALTGGAPDYKVIQTTKKETIILIEGDAMESVLSATQIIFTSSFSTESNNLVKIYSDYSIDLALSAKLYVNY